MSDERSAPAWWHTREHELEDALSEVTAERDRYREACLGYIGEIDRLRRTTADTSNPAGSPYVTASRPTTQGDDPE